MSTKSTWIGQSQLGLFISSRRTKTTGPRSFKKKKKKKNWATNSNQTASEQKQTIEISSPAPKDDQTVCIVNSKASSFHWLLNKRGFFFVSGRQQPSLRACSAGRLQSGHLLLPGQWSVYSSSWVLWFYHAYGVLL